MFFSTSQRRKQILLAGLGGICIGSMAVGTAAQASEESGRQSHFQHPPALDNVSSAAQTTGAWHDTHFITIDVPEDAGTPVAELSIHLETPDVSLDYDTEDTESFLGRPRDRGHSVDLATVSHDTEEGMVHVVFDRPVPPGQTVTVGLSPERNPRLPGVYNLGVTAYSEGDRQGGEFLGYERFHLYD
ncbi:DUF2808 domain-containing protein [Sodalinema gerasimenkoae]|uniref:DUF2808 domain-containing protein n=1 Tax=Sodalinema gerasimenkoae TaxID=2862348 RepID=UPI001359AA7B|nr:DUF2808 domain-containing protein [Sodalinema gerasimenkoae]